jgi:Arc/MetJ-type ribon-helix-helix transcriptional regulator
MHRLIEAGVYTSQSDILRAALERFLDDSEERIAGGEVNGKSGSTTLKSEISRREIPPPRRRRKTFKLA